MRWCGSPISPTAHITFCTFAEVFRPQILITESYSNEALLSVHLSPRKERERVQSSRRASSGSMIGMPSRIG